MITEKKKPKDQIFLEELIGSKFPVSSFESDIKNFFFIRKHSKKLWFSNIPCEIKVGDAALSLQKRKICFALYWNTKAKWYM